MAEVILPGTYIKVYDEGLISAGAVASGNIGIVGTANKGPIKEVQTISSFSEARALFGDAGDWNSTKPEENLSLIRSLELIFNNGGRTVYAVRTANNAAVAAKLEKKEGSALLLGLTAKTKGTYGNGISLEVIVEKNASQVVTARKCVISDSQNVEKYEFIQMGELVAKINESSQLVTAETEETIKMLDSGIGLVNLAGGADGEIVTSKEHAEGLELLENDIINIVLVAGLDTSDADILQAHVNKTAENKRERIGVIGAENSNPAAHTVNSDRLIVAAPGIKYKTVVPQTRQEVTVDLPASYTAAAIAGLIASLPVQSSPTNKVLTVSGLSSVYNTATLEKLVQKRLFAVEQRDGFRVVKGITTATNSAWHQITTRRIVDYAIYGVRSGCNPYIGKLNNERVRNAMKATLDAFLTRMVNNEALTSYELEVSATRAEQIQGIVQVTMTLRPTFSIDYIKVNMYLG